MCVQPTRVHTTQQSKACYLKKTTNLITLMYTAMSWCSVGSIPCCILNTRAMMMRGIDLEASDQDTNKSHNKL